MPGAHRQTDSRFCGATTSVTNQTTVFSNDLLWAVEGDKESHGRGDLINAGEGTVYIENKKVITAIKDTAAPDNANHSPGPTNPSGRSSNVFAY